MYEKRKGEFIMANVGKIFNAVKTVKMLKLKTPGQNLMGLLPKTAGAKGNITLSKTQLQLFAKTGSKQLQEVLNPILKSTKDPSLEIAYKAKSNYSIAGLRLRDGKEIIGQGAVSVNKVGTKTPVIKAKASVGQKGQTASATGFVDTGKKAKVQEFEWDFSRKKQVINTDVRAGNAFRINIAANEPQAIQLSNKCGDAKVLDKYNRFMQQGQKGLDLVMENIKKYLVKN